ncbi:MAG: hypothetical protein J4F39_10635, partial [Candidatus Latescibacteria bacterium]|nr:hypothetical protein [Candidatus Latescibacterota bacterium]
FDYFPLYRSLSTSKINCFVRFHELVRISVSGCKGEKSFEPDPVFGLVGHWVHSNSGNFQFIAAERLIGYLVDENIDSLTAQARLHTVRAITDSFLVFERIHIAQIRADGTYADSESGIGQWSVEGDILNLVDARGRRVEYQYHMSNINYLEISLDKRQFIAIVKQLTSLNEEMLDVIDRIFDGGYEVWYSLRRLGIQTD